MTSELIEENAISSDPSVETQNKTKLTCGLIMPISEIDGITKSHWSDVRAIIEEAISEIEQYDIAVSMVSESNEVRIIQKTIVQRIFNDDIVIVDVSAKNPNVMFELGLRLAFDKPFILLKDMETNYTFDISPIYHIEYPRGLRYRDIMDFKEELKNKLIKTYEASKESNGSGLYLKDFGAKRVSGIEDVEVPVKEYLEAMFRDIKQDMKFLSKNNEKSNVNNSLSWANIEKKIEEEILSYRLLHNLSDAEIYENKQFEIHIINYLDTLGYHATNGDKIKLLNNIFHKLEIYPF